MLATVALILLTGMTAGALGAMLGIGGAVLLVPVVNVVLGYPIFTAATVGLATMVGTSISVSFAAAGRPFLNARLGLVLLIASVTGAIAGVQAVSLFVSEQAAELVYGLTSIGIAVVVLSRLERRNIAAGVSPDLGPLDGCFEEPGREEMVSYRVRRLPLALSAAATAGIVSSIAGVGSGMIVVPVLNVWCGVPLRVAAVTSAFTIGLTAVPGLVGHYQLGHFTTPELAAASVVGVLGGARLGLRVSLLAPVRRLKLLMAGVLLVVGGLYLVRVIG